MLSEPSASPSSFAGDGFCLHVDCWLIRVVVAEGGVGCGSFLMKFATLIDSCFQTISLRCAMLFDSVLPTVELLSKLESILSNSAAALSTKSM